MIVLDIFFYYFHIFYDKFNWLIEKMIYTSIENKNN